MGTWGEGNFENDSAADFIDDFVRNIIKTIVHGLAQELYEEKLRYEPPDVLIAVDILATICGHYGEVAGVSERMVERWREIYLTLLEAPDFKRYHGQAQIDYVQQRKKVVHEVFDRLAYVVRENPPDEDD